MDNKKETWEKASRTWAQQAEDRSNKFTRLIWCVADFVNSISSPKRLLDVGCGPGLLCALLAEKGWDVYGMDLAEGMIKEARQRLSTKYCDISQRFRLCQDGSNPFQEQQFDVITAIQVFPYIEKYIPFIAALSSSLAPDGIVIASSTNRMSLFVLHEMASRLFRFPPHLRTLVNLARTGYHSGGCVKYATAQQAYSADKFDALFKQQGFEVIHSMEWYHIGCLDQNPLKRHGLWKAFARRLAWYHVGVYRKIMKSE